MVFFNIQNLGKKHSLNKPTFAFFVFFYTEPSQKFIWPKVYGLKEIISLSCTFTTGISVTPWKTRFNARTVNISRLLYLYKVKNCYSDEMQRNQCFLQQLERVFLSTADKRPMKVQHRFGRVENSSFPLIIAV